jgi:dTDP-4-dehydrorhamnose reductase
MSASAGVRWLVTGSKGQLGTAFVRSLSARSACFEAHGRELDVSDRGKVDRAVAALADRGPCLVLNAAAFTHVDRCEREPALAHRVNAEAPAMLAQACRIHGARLVHVSTDYVFDGTSQTPYTELDPPAPHSVYGRTKLEGERAVLEASDRFLVVRTSWIFGRGRNFVAAILARASSGEELRVVDDQIGRPTCAADLAEGMLGLLEAGAAGLYHLANRGVASWWDVARAALDHAGFAGVPIERVRTAELALSAPRPLYSVLDCAKAERCGVVLRSWRDALGAHLDSEDAPPGVRQEPGVRRWETNV